MDEILHVKLGISTKFYLWDINLSHTLKYIYCFTCTSIATHWGLHLQVIIYLLHCADRFIYRVGTEVTVSVLFSQAHKKS